MKSITMIDELKVAMTTPKQAVRQKCVECVQSPYEVDRMIETPIRQ